jgi:hypothetical protein
MFSGYKKRIVVEENTVNINNHRGWQKDILENISKPIPLLTHL